jgi:Carboxypeptidase regulatory-like domain
MTERTGKRLLKLGAAAAIVFTVLGFTVPMAARRGDETSLRVVVKDAASGDPIYQAQLTLQFQIPQKFRLPKWIAYSAKTNKKGEYTFRRINKGPIRLLVTADDHQSFGKEYEVTKDDSTIEVKMRKPQPQI